MPSWKDLYNQNNFLNLERLGSKTLIGEIERAEPHQSSFKGKEITRLVLDVSSIDARISLNQESCASLSKAFGEDYDEWVGKKVRVKRGSVKFGEGSVPAICVEPLSKSGK